MISETKLGQRISFPNGKLKFLLHTSIKRGEIDRVHLFRLLQLDARKRKIVENAGQQKDRRSVVGLKKRAKLSRQKNRREILFVTHGTLLS